VGVDPLNCLHQPHMHLRAKDYETSLSTRPANRKWLQRQVDFDCTGYDLKERLWSKGTRT